MKQTLLLTLFISLTACVTPVKEHSSFTYGKDIRSQAVVHRIDFSRNDYTVSVVRARNGRETVSSIAKRTGADFAVNGGFFHADGRPAGVLKMNHKLISCTQKQRGALLWTERQTIADRVFCDAKGVLKSHFGTKTGEYPYILGGVPLLIFEGKVVEDMSPEKALDRFMKVRFARTAVAVKGDHITLLVVDGSSTKDKESGVFKGFTISELAGFFKNQGVDYAVNLDGGGSSAMVIRNKVVNAVRGKERPVSEALIFKRK